jgi:membrane-associated phospholipid phosphatase
VKSESEIARRRKIGIALTALVLAIIALAFWADAAASAWVSSHTSGSIKHAAVLVSRMGDWPAHVAAGLIGVVTAFLSRRRDWVRIFLATLIACALAGVAARVIKIMTGRARPLVQTETLWNGPRLDAKYNAFPSGHTASSTAFFVTLFLARRKIGAPLLLIPVTIASARVLAGAHYFSDVIFAAALGIASAILIGRVIPLHSPLTRPTLDRFNDSTL